MFYRLILINKMETNMTQSKKTEVVNPNTQNQNMPNNIQDNNGSNSNNLKSKLSLLEEKIHEIAKEMSQHKTDVLNLKNQKTHLQETLKNKTAKVKSILLQDIDKVEGDMKRHFAHQTSENGRLQQKITSFPKPKAYPAS